ncbi:MAG TPA: holin [Patescibacteria group bacterium]|nr:holin [Patescibacteria group bacterium]
MQNRFKSKVGWLAIAALVGFILGNYGLYDVVGLTNESYQMLVDLIFAMLTAFGVWNNPADKDNF